jgi:hypothetical protein
MSSVSLALLVVLAVDAPSLKVVPSPEDARSVSVVAELSGSQVAALSDGPVTRRQGRNVLTFTIVDNSGTPGSPMLGDYQRNASRLTFTPRFRLSAGSTYTAKLHSKSGKTRTVTHRVKAASPRGTAMVTGVFPAARMLPANSLKFYIHFSQPMREGRAIFERIHLLDENGEKVHDPWRRTELWTEDARRFTLWIHPGRVKQGVNLREDFGPVLNPEKEYTLLIEQSVQSQSGQTLAQAHRKTFRTVPDDRTRPLPQNWKLELPPVGTRTPLRIEFGESLDHALLQRCVKIQTPDGQRVKTSIAVQIEDSVALLTPSDPWRSANYKLVVSPILEDLAGNTPARIFDTDLTRKPGPEPQLQINFRPRLLETSDEN